MTARELMGTTAALCLFCGVLWWGSLWRRDRSWLTWGTVGCGLVAAVFMVSAVVKSIDAKPWGAVVAEQGSVFSGPASNHVVLFALSEGAPFQVLDETDQWYKIEISGDKKGWIARSDTEVFRQY